jgi:hypothetical protein
MDNENILRLKENKSPTINSRDEKDEPSYEKIQKSDDENNNNNNNQPSDYESMCF